MLKLSDKNVNKNIYENYLKYLLEKYCNVNLNDNIIDNNPFLNFSCFYPLPNSLEVSDYQDADKINQDNNIYEFVGTPLNNRILFANRLLPHYITDPIPFTFPLKINKNTIELINTNCFYYEITIDKRIRDYWENETLSIGYGSITTPMNCNPGWISDTIGYHMDEGSLQYNQNVVKDYGPKCNIGDTIGSILVYIKPNYYKVFFTFNGSLIVNNNFDNNIIIKSHITPIIGYDYSCKIKVNFGNDIFKFDIKTFYNSNFVISQNNKFIDNHTFINKINTIDIIKKKIKNKKLKINTEIFTFNHNSMFTPLFSFTQGTPENNTLENLVLNMITQNNES